MDKSYSIENSSINEESERDDEYEEVEQFGSDAEDSENEQQEEIEDESSDGEESEEDIFEVDVNESENIFKPNNLDMNNDENHIVDNDDRISIGRLTEYERVNLLGNRAKQISEGAKPMVKLPNEKKYSAMEIAQLELKHRVMPLKIIRNRPDGKAEIWTLQELEYDCD